jgi:hypothetical protein
MSSPMPPTIEAPTKKVEVQITLEGEPEVLAVMLTRWRVLTAEQVVALDRLADGCVGTPNLSSKIQACRSVWDGATRQLTKALTCVDPMVPVVVREE